MMKVIVIRDIPNVVKGRAYEIEGYDSRLCSVVVLVKNSTELIRLALEKDCIFQASDCSHENTYDYRDMVLSLIESVEQAGGSVHSIMRRTESMTVREFMQTLAPNGVRFTCVDKT